MSASNDTVDLAVGDRVRFTGFVALSGGLPPVSIGDTGVIISVKTPGQAGFDYWVRLDSDQIFAFSRSELSSEEASDSVGA